MSQFPSVKLLNVVIDGVKHLNFELLTLINSYEQQLKLIDQDNEDVTVVGRVGNKEALERFYLFANG